MKRNIIRTYLYQRLVCPDNVIVLDENISAVKKKKIILLDANNK
jgi:hypothetical protein